jgi:hypothetical protein
VPKKPLGIIAIIVYSILSGLLLLPLGLLLLIVGQKGGASGVLLTLLGIVFFTLGVFLLAAVYGLITLQSWGRKTMIWCALTSSVLGFISIFPILPNQVFSIGNLVLQIVGIAISGIIIYYLTRERVCLLFSQQENLN